MNKLIQFLFLIFSLSVYFSNFNYENNTFSTTGFFPIISGNMGYLLLFIISFYLKKRSSSTFIFITIFAILLYFNFNVYYIELMNLFPLTPHASREDVKLPHLNIVDAFKMLAFALIFIKLLFEMFVFNCGSISFFSFSNNRHSIRN